MWEDEWRQHHLRRAMRTIEVEFNGNDVAAFKRYAQQGQDVAKTAASLGLSRDQVYRAKSLILKRLRELIRQQVTEEG